MSATIVARPTLRLAATLVLSLALFRYGHDIAKLVVEAPTVDFAIFYGFTKALWVGVDPFEPAGLRWVDEFLGVKRAGTAPTLMPAGYLVFLPFLVLPYGVARLLWLLLGQGCLVAALIMLYRRLAPEAMLALAGLFVVLSFQPTLEDVALGNVNLPVLALVTLAILARERRQPFAVALPLSLAASLKPPYLILIPFLWWLGSPGAALLALALALACSAVAAVVFGASWIGGYWHFLSVGSAPLHAWSRNLSPHAVLHRLTGVSGPDVLIEAAAIAFALAVIGAVLLISREVRQHPEGWLGAWALAIAALPLVSPLAEENHFVVLLFPLLFVLTHCGQLQRVESLWLIGVTVLLASRYSLEGFATFSDGVLSLAQTGKIVGVAALALLIARLIRLRKVFGAD